jgi:hypothetical protein
MTAFSQIIREALVTHARDHGFNAMIKEYNIPPMVARFILNPDLPIDLEKTEKVEDCEPTAEGNPYGIPEVNYCYV